MKEVGEPTSFFVDDLTDDEVMAAELFVGEAAWPEPTCVMVDLSWSTDIEMEFDEEDQELLAQHAASCESCQRRAAGAEGLN